MAEEQRARGSSLAGAGAPHRGDARRRLDRPQQSPTSSMSARSPSSICWSATPSRSKNHDGGPYTLHLSLADNRLVFTVGDDRARADPACDAVAVALPPPGEGLFPDLRELLPGDQDRSPPPSIEAIDMGRRGLHDEGSRLLLERLKGKIAVDIATARRLFTLLCALHWKG